MKTRGRAPGPVGRATHGSIPVRAPGRCPARTLRRHARKVVR